MITKRQFIAYYADRNDMSRAKSKIEVERFLDTFVDATLTEGGINFIGVMRSEIINVPERERMNPATREKIITPAHKTVKIRAGSLLTDPENSKKKQ